MTLTNLNLKSFDRIYPILIQKYNTLIEDPNANVLDKINQIIDSLNSMGKLSNDVVNNWNNVMAWTMNDGLTTDVSNKLNTMVSDGTFDSIFQKDIAPSLGDLTTLQTVDKSNLVNAVNEVDNLAKSNQTNLGNLANLTTTDKSNLVNAVNSNVASLAQIATYHVKDFATLQSTLTLVGSQLVTLLIPSNITITANTTIPSNVHLWFSPMGMFTVNNGVTLTINGSITAGLWQIFSGSGTVVGSSAKITACYPEWFGGKVNDNTVDNAPIFDKAQRFFPFVKLSIGDYYFNSLFKNVYSSTFEGIGRVNNLGYDLTNVIQQANLPVIQLDQPMFTLRNVTLKGNITNASNDGIYMPSLGSYSVLERVRISGCGGHGIHANGSSTFGIDLCHFHDMKISGNVGFGIRLNLAIGNGFNTSKFELIECTQNQAGGFYINNCRSLTFERCHAFWNENPNGQTMYGYTIQGDSNSLANIKFINCWSEQTQEHNYPDPTHKSGAFLVNGGTNISFDNCHTENEDRGFTINGGTNIIIDNPDIGVNSYATSYDIYISSTAKQVKVINYNMSISAVVVNLSPTSWIETTIDYPSSGRIPTNSKYTRMTTGTAVCSAQGSATQFQYNAIINNANAGDQFLVWTTSNTMRIGDNIQIPGAGSSGTPLNVQITDIDFVNKKIFLSSPIVTAITGESTTPATVYPITHSEFRNYNSQFNNLGYVQTGDIIWFQNPNVYYASGLMCVFSGTTGASPTSIWETFGKLSNQTVGTTSLSNATQIQPKTGAMVYSSMRVVPIANVTGITIASGLNAEQELTILNESAFTVTFDVSGTSKVAGGTVEVIQANSAGKFLWNAGINLWYRIR